MISKGSSGLSKSSAETSKKSGETVPGGGLGNASQVNPGAVNGVKTAAQDCGTDAQGNPIDCKDLPSLLPTDKGWDVNAPAAACVAGALSLDDAARVVALRSRAIAATLAGSGGMASVALGETDAVRRLAPWAGRVEVAAVNSPASVVIAGDADALDEALAAIEAGGVRVRRVAVDYASHTGHVEAIHDRRQFDPKFRHAHLGKRGALAEILGALVDHLVLDVRRQLPRIVRVRLADVDDEERGCVAVLRVEIVQGGNLPPERRSGVAAEDQHHGPAAKR